MQRQYKLIPIEDRFWSKVNKTPTCWLWIGATCNFGYGKIGIGGRKNRKLKDSHRLSWEIHNGIIPLGLCVLHKCDVPSCVNPAHLFLGTKKDNAADAVQKGRLKVWRPLNIKECKHGHTFTEENTIWQKIRTGKPYRVCRICMRAANRRSYLKLKGDR